MMRPHFASFMAGTTARAQKKEPVMLTCSARDHSSIGSSQNACVAAKPGSSTTRR